MSIRETPLELILRARASRQDYAARVFLSQWEIDSRLLERALQSIAIVFPHYSLHDSSHSRRILTAIGDVLGDARLEQLSSATIWLLLSAAFYHDAGMIVPDAHAREWWTSAELRKLLDDARNDQSDPLHAEARMLDGLDIARSVLWPFDIRRALTLIIAEYARRHHPTRAAEVVLEPQRYGMSSPRSELLIPSRLWRVLGAVCRVHGGSFADTMKLHKEANGISAGDKVHPRFVAAMLRLGDLLDLDNGRFCPTMTTTFGKMPPISLSHLHKHASVDHFLVNKEKIEVEATCPDVDSYNVTNHWLEMLKSELANLRANWNSVAPCVDFGGLPSSGPPLMARLPTRFISTDFADTSFRLDSDRTLSMLRDSGLYQDPQIDFIRELIQNAHDAIILRAGEEWDGFPDDEDPDRLRKVRDEIIARGWKIRVTIKSSVDNIDDSDMRIWHVAVADDGIGMSRDEVGQIKKVATSNKFSRSTRIPEWLWASGDFGIGLQSVFYVCPEFTIHSYDLRSRQGTSIRMHRTQGIYALEWPPEHPYRYGSTVALDIQKSSIPRRLSANGGGQYTNNVISEFDIVKHRVLPYHASMIIDAIKDHAQGCIVPIEVVFEGEMLDVSQPAVPRITSSGVALRDVEVSAEAMRSPTRFRYRGIDIRKAEVSMYWWSEWANASYDFYFGRSSDILQMNRDNFRKSDRLRYEIPMRCTVAMAEHIQEAFDEAEPTAQALYLLIAEQMKQLVTEDEDDEVDDEETIIEQEFVKPWFERVRRATNAVLSRPTKFDGNWKEHVPFGKRGKDEQLTFARVANDMWAWQEDVTGPNGSKSALWRIAAERPQQASDGFVLMKRRLQALTPFFKHTAIESWASAHDAKLYHLSQRLPQIPGVAPGSLAFVLDNALSMSPHVGFRVWLPLPAEYDGLALTRIRSWARSVFWIPVSGPFGLLPMRIEREYQSGDKVTRRVSAPNIVEYVRWVHARRCVQSVTLEKIASLTLKLLREAHGHFELLRRERGHHVEIAFDIDELHRLLERDLSLRLED